MIHVVEQASTFTDDLSKGTVVLESDIVANFAQAIEELGASDARSQALGHAARLGCPDPRVNGQAMSPYAINSEGMPLEDVRGEDGNPLPPQHPKMQVARYRVEIPVTRKLV